MNPRWRVERVIREAAAPSDDLLEAMGFSKEWLTRFPHELSGGQLQRVSIIRALSGKPKYLIADEITASLDPISQAKIWQSLKVIAEQEHIGVLVISHDQALIDRICTSTITLR
jgi:ABC-type dipeptide/oligopeptide/nickel transport system ATPase subunit